ncbi:hypothetical protein Bca52824_041605 [Brassica carinata]|uniref:Phorbol-ester/DAG-type domain-containing protein n=1 Tax=Brassica carinata TaxID=52824 RepID=A0A8X7V059_BRACI|nr:hypothetical protein Bca52824_041605 [Brassica carinata]
MFFSSDHPKHEFEESQQCISRGAICYLCKNKFSLVEESSNAFYCCQGCGSSFHKDCLTVTYPKCHEHTLTFIRRKIPFPCDVCGQEFPDEMYGCLQCDFFVNRHCIYLPKVIKITRHSHRLSHVLRMSDGDNVCGIFRSLVDVGYGGYSCIDKTCNYVAHFIVAASEVDDVAPLLLVEDIDGESTWRHFSHDHDLLRVVEEQGSEELCQACILPTYKTGKFLRCKECDFAIHETCASLPRKMAHGLHVHPLTLHVETGMDSSFVLYCGFKMDVRCASFVEPFNHTALPHDPFYLGVDFNEYIYRCYGCRQRSRFTARCVQGSIDFDFKCLNLPGRVEYKCDDHPLTLYYDHKLKVIAKGRIIYTCRHCFTTLHVDCILGKYPYLKCGNRIKVNGFEVKIASNDGASRPICQTCHRICQDKQVFNGKDQVCFCSIKCIPSQACS